MNKPTMGTSSGALGAIALAAVLSVPVALAAQTDVEELGRRRGATPPPGYFEFLQNHPRAFRFSENGVWRSRAGRVAEERNRARTLRNRAALVAGPLSQSALGGDLNVPVLLVLYANTDSTELVGHSPRPALETRLFGTQPAPPYSVFTYYQELSNDALHVNGTVLDWVRVPSNDVVYEAGGNGLLGGTPDLIADIVAAQDPFVDYGLFDNDGPDNVPNSGDDNGIVDILVIVHPEVGGECGNSNIWSHRWFYRAWTGALLSTGDPSANGGTIKVDDYVIQGGQGGADGCTAGAPQAMGVVAHELGHGLGLPDLYDTNPNFQNATSGIGEWGLMGAGNWHVPEMPAHMSAWSKAQLGWITEALIDSDTSLVISPIESSDTAYIVPIDGTNQYFELSNRQLIGSDAGLANPNGCCGPLNTGLLIWHVDSVLIRQRENGNSVNFADVHGLALEEADGDADLWKTGTSGNRGDAGDAFPGTSGNTSFGFNTNPGSERNDDTPTFIRVHNIVETAVGDVTVDISFARPTVVSLTHSQGACPHCDTFFAAFTVDGATQSGEFVDYLSVGTTRTVSIDAIQMRDSDRRRYTWVSWSDGGARTHDLVASGAGESLLGTTTAEFLVTVNVSGNGTVTSADLPALSVGADASAGEFAVELSDVTLVATPGAGYVFEQWDTDAGPWLADTLILAELAAPRAATAVFLEVLEATTNALGGATMGFDYSETVTATGGNGNYSWSSSSALPSGLTLLPNGTIQGVPAESGPFSLDLQVASGRQTTPLQLSLVVEEPSLATTSVVGAVLNTSQTLSAEELRFLDLQGNSNGNFDLGDFLAWVEQNNIQVSAPTTSRIVGQSAESGSDR